MRKDDRSVYSSAQRKVQKKKTAVKVSLDTLYRKRPA